MSTGFDYWGPPSGGLPPIVVSISHDKPPTVSPEPLGNATKASLTQWAAKSLRLPSPDAKTLGLRFEQFRLAPDRIFLARGLVLDHDEYEDRFRGIDLDRYRSRMDATAFATFVRFRGIVKGGHDSDLIKTARLDSER